MVFDEYSNPDINLCFASYDDIEDLCRVIDWACVSKPSASSPGEGYFGWIGEKHLVKGALFTAKDEEHNAILVAKLKTA